MLISQVIGGLAGRGEMEWADDLGMLEPWLRLDH